MFSKPVAMTLGSRAVRWMSSGTRWLDKRINLLRELCGSLLLPAAAEAVAAAAAEEAAAVAVAAAAEEAADCSFLLPSLPATPPLKV